MKWITILGLVCSALAQTQTGKIKGTVTDDTCAPIAGAIVRANLKASALPAAAPSARPSFMPFTPVGPSDAKGAFEIDGVTAGAYTMCVWVPEAAYLDPCAWTTQPVIVTVGAGATVDNAKVVAPKGVFVTIRIQDQNGLLMASPAKDDIRVGTFVNGKSPLVPALVTQRDGEGRTMAIVAPPGTPLSISVSSSAFALTDATGNALAATGVLFPVTSSAISTVGAAPSGVPALTVQVVGASAVKP